MWISMGKSYEGHDSTSPVSYVPTFTASSKPPSSKPPEALFEPDGAVSSRQPGPTARTSRARIGKRRYDTIHAASLE
jgi:hypothetical protein